jgi:polyisoprenoid-binding protein YceI
VTAVSAASWPGPSPMTTTTAPAYTDLTGTYTLDPAHTRIGFVARHAMVTKVRGAFNEFEGTDDSTLG